MKKVRLAIILILLPFCPLAALDILEYRLVSSTAILSRGDTDRELLTFGLTFRGDTLPQIAVRGLRWSSSPGLLLQASLYRLNGATATRLATAVPDSTGRLRFILTEDLVLAASQSNSFAVRGSLRQFGSAGSVLALTNAPGDFTLAPAATAMLSNKNDPAGSWPNTNARSSVLHAALVLSNENVLLPATAGLERGEEVPALAFSLRAPNALLTGHAVSINRLSLTNPQSCYERLTLYRDDGDGAFSRSDDEMIADANGKAETTTFNPATPIVLAGTNRSLFWVIAKPRANAPTSAAAGIALPDNKSFFSGTMSLILLGGVPPVASPSGLVIIDTKAPDGATLPGALAGYGRARITWTNPLAADLGLVRVAWSAVSQPALPTGTDPCVNIGTVLPGGQTTADITNLNPALTYHFSIFARDTAGTWAPAYAMVSMKPDWYTNTLAGPEAVSISASSATYAIKWRNPNVPVISWGVRICDLATGTVHKIDALTTTSYTITPGMLGLGVMPAQALVAVVQTDINGTVSNNDFSTLEDARSRGQLVRLPDQAEANRRISVWNTIFRAGSEAARIIVRLDAVGQADVRIYSITGELLATLVNRTLPAGTHEWIWNGTARGSAVNPGLYLVQVRAAGETRSVKLLVKR